MSGLFVTKDYEKNSIKNSRARWINDDLGKMVARQIFMTDGLEYTVKSFNPHSRSTDIAVTMTVPWLTEPAGYNTHMALALAKLGFPVDLIGTERNLELKPYGKVPTTN